MSANLAFGPFVLDIERGALLREGRPVAISSKGIQLLHALLQVPGRVLAKADLMEAAWPGMAVEESNLSVQIAALRKQLGSSPDGGDWIATVPRVGYRFIGSVHSCNAPPDPSAERIAESEQRPAIAVLPFTNLSGSPDQQYFGDAIANDIITALTRFRWFSVVARNSSFAFRDSSVDVREIAKRLGARYVVEGSHHQVGHRIRITAQLIDAIAGSCIWAERYERDVADIFVIQDEISDSVIGSIEPLLLNTESRLAHAAGDVEGKTAWNLVRRGVWQFHKVERESHLKARDLFRSAAALDAELTEAHIWLARVSGGIVLWGWTHEPAAVRQEGLTAAFTAIRLDEKNPYAHYGLAITSCAAGEFQQATRAAMRAIDLSPGFALGHLVLGLSALYGGRAEEARSSLQHGLRLNWSDPHNVAWLDLLALAHLLTGNTVDAVQIATEALHLRPGWYVALETMAICCAAADRIEQARRCLEEIEKGSAYPSDILVPLKAHNPAWRAEIERLLQRARGFQDGTQTPDLR
jgi:TolB-like protein/Flp pilus assembly protein TadD